MKIELNIAQFKNLTHKKPTERLEEVLGAFGLERMRERLGALRTSNQ